MQRPRLPLLAALLLASAALVGCPSTGTSPAALNVSAERLEFGDVNVGLDSTLSFTLTNSGGGPLDLFSLTLLEGSESIWSVQREPGEVLESGAALTVSVTFTPSSQGQQLGRIQVRSSDDANPSQFVVLDGSGGPSVVDGDGDGYSPADGDCNDGNGAMFPGNTELCDGLDNDCDGALLPDETDEDNDGFAQCDGDCNDTDGNIYPGAPEACDGEDSDCDGTNADFDDADLDTFTPCQGDCDDSEATAFPGNAEVCDGIDNDCTGVVDDLDNDGDGHSPCASGGDCDDDDPFVFPVVVDSAAAGGGDGTDDSPYNSIQAGLDNLDAVCRTVALAEGDYSFSGSINGDTVSLVGQSREGVVIGPDGGRFLEVTGNGDVTLSSMTLTGFTGSADGGVLSATNASLTLVDVQLEANTTSGDGGAVAVFTGELTMDGTTFMSNGAGDDGGAIALVSSTLTDLGGNHFEDNSGVRGGAMIADGSLVTLDGSTFHANTAADDGGALMLIGLPEMQIGNLEVFANTAGLTGGGIAVNNTNDSDGWLRNLAVRNNVAGDPAGGGTVGTGGGIYIGGNVASFVVANNTLTENTTVNEGGGIHVDADDASGLFVASNIVGWSGGDSGFEVRATVGGTYMANTSFGTGAVDGDFEGDVSGGSEGNNTLNPQFVTGGFTPDGNPHNDALTLASGSPMRNSGLDEADAPAGYALWNDLDGTQNDRGATGGPAGQ
ncbi:MAG: choice-of-anchor D domain-containing protein [Deltaproteobacteria bacterium]|nr:choice-of-anchor D domain-containing protein [Deltaproteobacteria bacterium]